MSTQCDPSVPASKSRTSSHNRSLLHSLAGSALGGSSSPPHTRNEDTIIAKPPSFPTIPTEEIWKCILALKDCEDEDIDQWLHLARWKGKNLANRDSNVPSLQSSTERSSIYTNRTSISDPRSSIISTISSRTSCAEFPKTDAAQPDSSMLPSTSDLQPPTLASNAKSPIENIICDPTAGPWKRLPDPPSRHGKGKLKKPLPKQKHFCTFCPKECNRKADWFRHEEEFHEPQENYLCQDCGRDFVLRDRFVRHHMRDHGCYECKHADVCRIAVVPKKAYGCGFCGQCMTSWAARKEHLTEHQLSGKKRTDWDHSRVILGLLCQDDLQTVWQSLVAQHYREPWPRFVWNKSLTVDLQKRLESGGGPSGWKHANAEEVVQEAYVLATPMLWGVMLESDAMDLCQSHSSTCPIEPLPSGIPSHQKSCSSALPNAAGSYGAAYHVGAETHQVRPDGHSPTVPGFPPFQLDYPHQLMTNEPSFFRDAVDFSGLEDDPFPFGAKTQTLSIPQGHDTPIMSYN